MANTLQYSCLEKTPDREAWQTTLYRVAKGWTGLKQLCMHRCKIIIIIIIIFAYSSSAPVRVDREGATATWLAGILVAQSVQGHRLPLPHEL